MGGFKRIVGIQNCRHADKEEGQKEETPYKKIE